MWTVNFQMFKLDLEKAEEPENKLPTSVGFIGKAREFQKNIYFCFIDYAKSFDYVHHNKLWKILQEMGIADHLTCLLRNLYAGQEVTVITRHGSTDWFQIGKGVRQGCVLSCCLFNLYAKYILRNAGLDEAHFPFIESIAVSHSTSHTTSVLTSFTTIQRFPETPISSL